MEDAEKTIVITMEEYKELLIIKGKYEELKSQKESQTIPTLSPVFRDFGDGKWKGAEITS